MTASLSGADLLHAAAGIAATHPGHQTRERGIEMGKPHVTINGIPGLNYCRRAYSVGQVIAASGCSYVVTNARNDGDVYGDGCDAVEIYADPIAENLRVCCD